MVLGKNVSGLACDVPIIPHLKYKLDEMYEYREHIQPRCRQHYPLFTLHLHRPHSEFCAKRRYCVDFLHDLLNMLLIE